jgi:hypothetical protein
MNLAARTTLTFVASTALGSVTLSLPQAGLLPPPYQVAGIERRLPDRDVEAGVPGLDDAVVVVELDDADSMPPPDREFLARATIVGTDGVAAAHLVDVERRCEFLCSDERASCRHVALYSGFDPARLGTPLLALPGEWTLTDHAAAEPVAEVAAEAAARDRRRPPTETVADIEALRRLLAADDEPVRLIWSSYEDDPTRYRLVPDPTAPEGLALETLQWDGQVVVTPARECAYAVVDGIGSLDCSGFATLLDGARPLLVSLTDYNLDIAQVVASFVHDARTYHVIRLGLKAQTVFGLLVQTGDGWTALLRPRTFDLLCAP